MNEKQRLKFIALVQEIAEQVGGYVYWRYSGRGMYGKECVGVVADSTLRVIELAANKGLFGSAYDSLGKQYIVYWPTLVALDGEGDDA